MPRPLLAALLFAAASSPTWAQDGPPLVVGATFELAGRPLVERVDPVTGRVIETLRTLTNPDVRYLGEREVEGQEDRAVFHFLLYGEETDARATFNGPDPDAPYVFELPSDDFGTLATTRIYDKWAGSGAFEYGVITLPVKLRAAPFHYESSLALGPSLGYTWRASARDDVHVGLLLSTGIASVDVSAGDSDGFEGDDSNRPAFYGAIGAVFHVGEFQVGLLTGLDWINGDNQDGWDYQGEPWVSIGLGINGFVKDRKRSSASSQ